MLLEMPGRLEQPRKTVNVFAAVVRIDPFVFILFYFYVNPFQFFPHDY